MNDQTDLPIVSMTNTKKVQDIANRAVTAASRDNYPTSVHHATVPVRDDSQA